MSSMTDDDDDGGGGGRDCGCDDRRTVSKQNYKTDASKNWTSVR
jgi:hypothetical protein